MNIHRHGSINRCAALALMAGIALGHGAAPTCAQQATARQPVAAVTQAASNAKPSPKVLAAWRGKVLAHIEAQKRAISSSSGGVSTVAFSIDRTGRVLSSQVVKSSGSAALDTEAVALTQRASPVPPPPTELGGAKLYLKVPISFSR